MKRAKKPSRTIAAKQPLNLKRKHQQYWNQSTGAETEAVPLVSGTSQHQWERQLQGSAQTPWASINSKTLDQCHRCHFCHWKQHNKRPWDWRMPASIQDILSPVRPFINQALLRMDLQTGLHLRSCHCPVDSLVELEEERRFLQSKRNSVSLQKLQHYFCPRSPLSEKKMLCLTFKN